MAGAAWAPSLFQVAAYVPSRTRDASQPAADVLTGTFTPDTTPTDVTVADVFIPAAVAEVVAACGTVPDTLAGLAGEAAALRAAADIELAYPERAADVEVYRDLDARAKDALARLVAALATAGAGGEALLPVWAMPDPPPWGDINL